MDLNPTTQNPFDIFALKEVPVPLWNVPDLFIKFQKELLMGQPVNELNPRLVFLRLGHLTASSLKFMISY